MYYSWSSNFSVEVKLHRIPHQLILNQWQKADKCALYSKFCVFNIFPVKITIVKISFVLRIPHIQWKPDFYWQIISTAKLQFLLQIKFVCGWG